MCALVSKLFYAYALVFWHLSWDHVSCLLLTLVRNALTSNTFSTPKIFPLDQSQGQQGSDTIYGGADEDDLIGGHNVPYGADGSDTICGDDNSTDTSGVGRRAATAAGPGLDSHDVILGDNGRIDRRTNEPVGPWPAAKAGTWVKHNVSMNGMHVLLGEKKRGAGG